MASPCRRSSRLTKPRVMNEKLDNVDKENNKNEVNSDGIVIIMTMKILMMILIVPLPTQGDSSKMIMMMMWILMKYFDQFCCNAFVWSGSDHHRRGRGGERG